MKNLINYIVLFILLLTIPFIGFGQNIDYFPNGGPTIDRDSKDFIFIVSDSTNSLFFKGGPFTGTTVEYYENGQLYSKETYKDGKRDGLYESYHQNGKLNHKVPYKDGFMNGLSEEHYENGKLKFKGLFRNDKKDGVFESYFEDGQLKSTKTYKDGEQID